MAPKTRDELRKLVTEATVDIYEELTPQLITRIQAIKENTELTWEQQQDELLLEMMGYVKSCTNEIMIDVLAQVLELPEERRRGRIQYGRRPVEN